MASNRLRELYGKIMKLQDIISDDNNSIEEKITASNSKNRLNEEIKKLEKEEGV